MRISTAGVVEKDGRYLIALRKPGTSIGEKWEFPGGKAEPGETPEEALTREFQEELSLNVNVGDEFFEGRFTNGNREYCLKAFHVKLISSIADVRLLEHSEIRWVTADELKSLPFPSSDTLICDFLKEQI